MNCLEKISFLYHKIKQMFLYFGSCSRMQFCSIMSDDILILIDVHTCTAWFVIALVRIVYLFIYLALPN